MTPKENSEASESQRKKGESGETEEEATIRLLNEDPMDWMLKNEQVSNMISVRRKLPKALKHFKCFRDGKLSRVDLYIPIC